MRKSNAIIDIEQVFFIRIKNNFTIFQARKLRDSSVDRSNVDRDVTCYLGKNDNQSQNRMLPFDKLVN